ncbi:hypothetical protein ABPG75_002850 [Micractinium tetrahymenae]
MGTPLQVGVGLIAAGGAVLIGQSLWEVWRAAQARARRPNSTTPHGNPPPKVAHAVLTPEETQYKRIIILGDIHGCPDELQSLLDKVQYRQGVDLLLSVGDLVNKGPDSEKVLKMAKELGMQAVRGNHDDAAVEAFRAWLSGRDMPKPAKHHWVPGLEESLAALLADLPFTLQLPAYNVILVHAGLVPGMPLEQQLWTDLEKMRDVMPAAETGLADEAAAALKAGAPVDSLPTGDFDWGAAEAALAEVAAAAAKDRAAGQRPASGSGSSGGGGAPAGSPHAGSAGQAAAAQQEAEPGLPPQLQLRGREQPSPLGRAWASVWPGPLHVFFGHDAKRRLQRHPAATGLDTGCVYGGQLTAAVLPPLDEQGRPLEQRLNLPPDAEAITLASSLPAYLVSVPSKEVHSDKFLKPEQQKRGQQQELAKLHTRQALAAHPHHAQHAQHAEQQSTAAAAAPKSAADKKQE